MILDFVVLDCAAGITIPSSLRIFYQLRDGVTGIIVDYVS